MSDDDGARRDLTPDRLLLAMAHIEDEVTTAAYLHGDPPYYAGADMALRVMRKGIDDLLQMDDRPHGRGEEER